MGPAGQLAKILGGSVAMSMTAERRKARRFKVVLSVVLSPGRAHYLMETWDVSEMGLCLLSKTALPVGSQPRMVFGRPPYLRRLSAIGTVRWSENGRGAGIEFASISPNDQQALRQFLSLGERLEQLMLQQPVSKVPRGSKGIFAPQSSLDRFTAAK